MAQLYKDPKGVSVLKPSSDSDMLPEAAADHFDHAAAIEQQILQLQKRLAEVGFNSFLYNALCNLIKVKKVYITENIEVQ